MEDAKEEYVMKMKKHNYTLSTLNKNRDYYTTVIIFINYIKFILK